MEGLYEVRVGVRNDVDLVAGHGRQAIVSEDTNAVILSRGVTINGQLGRGDVESNG